MLLAWVAACYIKDTCAFLKLAYVNNAHSNYHVCICLDVKCYNLIVM